jgi:hypothetical protein
MPTLRPQRGPFETLLLEIAESAEEWLTSAQSLGLSQRVESNRVLPFDRPTSALRTGRPGLSAIRSARRSVGA